MADYISREAAKEFLKRAIFGADIKIDKWMDAIPAADVVAKKDFNDCRNELCLQCGRYRESHLGACDGCRWQSEKWR